MSRSNHGVGARWPARERTRQPAPVWPPAARSAPARSRHRPPARSASSRQAGPWPAATRSDKTSSAYTGTRGRSPPPRTALATERHLVALAEPSPTAFSVRCKPPGSRLVLGVVDDLLAYDRGPLTGGRGCADVSDQSVPTVRTPIRLRKCSVKPVGRIGDATSRCPTKDDSDATRALIGSVSVKKTKKPSGKPQCPGTSHDDSRGGAHGISVPRWQAPIATAGSGCAWSSAARVGWSGRVPEI